MSWNPSEGLRRAPQIVTDLEKALYAEQVMVSPVARWRLTEIVAKALDQALADGSEVDALNAVVGNGHGRSSRSVIVPPDEGERSPQANWGESMPSQDFLEVAEAKIAPKKARGRPKGSKNKYSTEYWAQVQAFYSSEKYRTSAEFRVIQGKAPHLEGYHLQMLHGKPVEHHEHSGPDGKPVEVIHKHVLG